MSEDMTKTKEIVENDNKPISKTNSQESLSISTNSSIICAICCDQLSVDTYILPCEHKFCSNCITEYFTYEIKHLKREVTCPICRIVLFEVIVNQDETNEETISTTLQIVNNQSLNLDMMSTGFDNINTNTEVIPNKRTCVIIGNISFKLFILGLLIFMIYIMTNCYYFKACTK